MKPKRLRFRPQRRLPAVCIASALAALSAQTAATEFAGEPILAAGASFPPNILLALSIEYPTAGSAYQEAVGTAAAGFERMIDREMFDNSRYIGYFDAQKCYRYVGNPNIPNDDDGYFTPERKADGNGYCGGSLFSGKALNWMTMTSVDIFRHAMTGGNRARGGEDASIEPKDYREADTESQTFLRRAYVATSKNGVYSLNKRHFLSGGWLQNILPNEVLGSVETGEREFSIQGSTQRKEVLHIHNKGFKLTIGGTSPEGWRSAQLNAKPTASEGKSLKTYNVVVEVCKPGLEEANCREYPGRGGQKVLKPVGVMQDKIAAARFGVFGYANIDGNDINGGILRSRMKFLNEPLPAKPKNHEGLGNEINSDGTFAVNPDQQDAAKTGVSNSGVINYLNKFGDTGQYKDKDPAGELFYAGLRYLRSKRNFAAWTDWLTQLDAGKRKTATDGFPVITDWTDPLLARGQQANNKEVVCRPNYLMYIGDTFTHADNDVPNFPHSNNVPGDDSDIDTLASLRAIATQEGRAMGSFTAGSTLMGAINVRGEKGSYGSIAGLAYWARTHDIRTDLAGRQYLQSIMIDVVEHNNYRSSGSGSANLNSFYWAAKYGGFRSSKAEQEGAAPSLTLSAGDRSRWTADPIGTTSLNAFADGVPRNYAAANSPENMVLAINRSFNNVGTLSDTPSQAALAVEQNDAGLVDLASNPTPLFLQSSYSTNDTGWQGDIIAYTLNPGSRSGTPEFTRQWQYSKLLTRSSGMARKVFTRSGSSFEPLNTVASGASAQSLFGLSGDEGYTAKDLADYALGSKDKEKSTANPDGVFRPRPDNGLLGTVINSSVAIIPAPAAERIATGSRQCTYAGFNTLKNRKPVYAFAANDGMLHIIDADGKERFTYMPSPALGQLQKYADLNTRHVYINDGSPIVQEICSTNGGAAKSVIVGTTGRGGNKGNFANPQKIGSAVYAVDATRIGTTGYSASVSDILWEFSNEDDADLGLTVHAPVPVKWQKPDGTPIDAVVVSGGYNALGNKGYLFILQTDKSGPWALNQNYWKIELGNGAVSGGKAGVGMPKPVDINGDGLIEQIYVGDEAGNLRRADYTNNVWSQRTLMETGLPITGAPDIHRMNGRNFVIFNTGMYFQGSDGTKPDLQNYAYGFEDHGNKISPNGMVEQEIKEQVASVGKRTYYTASQNPVTDRTKGWKLRLPAGYIGIDDALVRRGRTAQFFVFSVNNNDEVDITNSTGNICANNSGKSALIEVDLRTGGLYTKPVFDTNRDGSFDTADALSAMSVNEGSLAIKRKTVTVLPGRSAKRYDAAISHGDSNDTADEERLNTFSKTVRRISWRELF